MSVVSISQPRPRPHHQPLHGAAKPATLQLTVAASGADPTIALRELLAHIAATPDLAVITPARAAGPHGEPDLPYPGDGADPDGDRGTIRLHARSRRVYVGADEVTLCRLEYDLLAFLVENPDQVFTRGQLLSAVWDDTFTGPRTVDVHVRRLRAKLDTGRPLIATVRGIGYRLASNVPVTIDTAPTPTAGVPPTALGPRPVFGCRVSRGPHGRGR
jgi:DNA-binding winged helix-turn-helix (wHTH) protein